MTSTRMTESPPSGVPASPLERIPDATGTHVTAAIAREMVAVYKEQFGRGPTRVKVAWADRDTIVCVLDDTLTRAEQKLVSIGSHVAVRAMRVTLQHATADDFCRPIEAHTGRKVRSFHSSIDTLANGQSIELFVLHPSGYTGESRLDIAAHTDETQ